MGVLNSLLPVARNLSMSNWATQLRCKECGYVVDTQEREGKGRPSESVLEDLLNHREMCRDPKERSNTPDV